MGTTSVGPPSSSIKDRIQLWQEQGGGVVDLTESTEGLNDACVQHDNLQIDASCSYTQPPSLPFHGQRMPLHTPSGRSDRRSRHETIRVDSRPRSAPTKRVVSDGHWRKYGRDARSPLPGKDVERCTTLQDEEQSGGPPAGIIDFQAHAALVERRERRKRRTQSTLETRQLATSGIGGNQIGLSSVSQISNDLGKENLLSPQSVAKSPSHHTKPTRKEKRRSVCNEYQAVSPPDTMSNLKDQRSFRSEKANMLRRVLSDSRQALARQPSESIVTPRVPSIQAWLECTPDPFGGDGLPPANIIEHGESSVVSELHGLQTSVEDPNHIWDAVNDVEAKVQNRVARKTRDRHSSVGLHSQGIAPMKVSDRHATDPSDALHEVCQKIGDSLPENAELSLRSLKRRQARKSTSSPVIRDSRDNLSTSVNEYQEGSVYHASLQDEHAERFATPIVRRKRTNDWKRSFREGTDACSSTAEQRAAEIESKHETLNEKPSSMLHQRHVPAAELGTLPDENCDGKMSASGRRSSRLTRHADLISVLSMPRHTSKRTKVTKSSRVESKAPECSSAQDIMLELEMEEIKYTRELRTLIDGVVPVLLTCVLSKAESAVAAGLFRSPDTASHESNVTRPIVDMAIALERLKSLHRRMPMKDPSLLLTWAHGAKRVYGEYLKAWRLGFQDVIVNLAPATEASSGLLTTEREELARDLEGDVVDSDGEKVDVAFLLKRPLVRLKHLARTVTAINMTLPSAETARLTLDYDGLVERARARVEEERARLEDEAAASIDATRSRDPRSLAPLNGVIIDTSRRVRARDYFGCTLQHSTGQSLDCQIELILREEAADSSRGGDLLICEVDGSGRWLLFPPISSSSLSARLGETTIEMVLMIRGSDGTANQWQEMLLLKHFEESTVIDWKNMLGSEPAPLEIARSQSFVSKDCGTSPLKVDAESSSRLHQKLGARGVLRPPSPSEIQVPIGEQANNLSREWPSHVTSTDETVHNGVTANDLGKRETRKRDPDASQDPRDGADDLKSLPSQLMSSSDPFSSDSPKPLRSLRDRLTLSGTTSMSGLRRNNAKRQSRHYSESNASSEPPSPQTNAGSREPSPNADGKAVKPRVEPESGSLDNADQPGYSDRRARLHRDVKGHEPSMAVQRPNTPKDHDKSNSLVYADRSPSTEREKTSWKSATRTRASGFHPSSPTKKPLAHRQVRSHSSSPSLTKVIPMAASSSSPEPPLLTAGDIRVGRSSSPLKRQYDPSVKSETSVPESDLEDLVSVDDDVSSMTESDDDDDPEAGDVPMPLVPPVLARRAPPTIAKLSAHATPEGSIKPSDSASQAPYKAVPVQRQEAVRTVASLFAWSDQGSWEALHPDECSIVVSPGLIEAFEMSAAHSSGTPLPNALSFRGTPTILDDTSQTTGHNDEVQGERPLVALELTPLVPLRRGTAIDISIRSPPTSKSRITTRNNLMFRSRSAEECEGLYAMINHARIHNPTYIALQNARGPFFMGATYADAVGRRPGSHATSSRSSWFGGLGRTSSYRAKSRRTPSISPSQSSVGTMSSAFSALRRFGRGDGGKFNIALSTISSRQGMGSDPGTYSISDNSSAKDMATPMASGMVANNDGSLGLKDAKIRLYLRENASRWRDLGSARLTILRPENDACGLRGDGQIMHEKRILIHGKTKGEVLLDTQLGESSFERVARTGIAMSIWEDVVGPNGELGRAGAVGGVAAVKTKVYMIQVRVCDSESPLDLLTVSIVEE